MLAVFSLRLAAGMIACLLVLPARLINQRFYRAHFLTALGLATLAWYFLGEVTPSSAVALHWLLGASVALTFAGSFAWSLEGAPAGRTLIVLSVLALSSALALSDFRAERGLLGGFTSAAVLGAALTAMLMGHSYLVAPSMSLLPLLRLIALFAVTVLVRMAVDGYRLWWWTQRYSWHNLNNDTLLWLPVRWGVGLLLPLGLAWMAWQTTKIRSTQSATGILYVVVIFVFLGELTSLLLREKGVAL